jgi:hypothetical protein
MRFNTHALLSSSSLDSTTSPSKMIDRIISRTDAITAKELDFGKPKQTPPAPIRKRENSPVKRTGSKPSR